MQFDQVDPAEPYVFHNNTFRRIYSQFAAVYSLETFKYEDIRLNLTANKYFEVYGLSGGILFLDFTSSYLFQADKADVARYLEKFSNDIGLIVMDQETVTGCQTHEESLYRVSVSENMMALIVRNSVFTQNYYNLFDLNKVQLYCHNCTFSNKNIGDYIPPDVVQHFNSSNPPTMADALLYEWDHYKSNHVVDNSTYNFNPTAEQLKSTKKEVQQIKIVSSYNEWSLVQSIFSAFYSGLRFGSFVGLPAIFNDFDMSNGTLSQANQFINCKIESLDYQIYLKEVISIQQYSKVVIRNSTFNDIESLVISKQSDSELYIINSTIVDIGIHILKRKELAKFDQFMYVLDKRLNISEVDIVTDSLSNKIPNGFIQGQDGYTELQNCTFNRSMSIKGLISVTSNENVFISGSRFERIVGEDQAAVLFVIQNEDGRIMMQDSIIVDSLSKSSLISLTFSKIELNNVTSLGNYGDIISNGLSMIFSSGIVRNSLVDNERNNINQTSDEMLQVEAGFANMNYQSTIHIINSTFKGLQGQSASFIYATGQSSVIIDEGS